MGFPAIAAQLGITVGLWVINRLLRDDTRKLPKPQPEGLEFPRVSIDTPIPYVAGTVKVTPVLIWYGNVGTTLQASGSFSYRADMLFAVGVPMWDEATAPWSSWRTATPPRARTLWYGDRKLPLQSQVQPATHNLLCQAIIRPSGAVILEAGVRFYDGRANQDLAGTQVAGKMAVAGIPASDLPGFQHRMLLSVLATPGSVAAAQPTLGGLGANPRISSVAVEVSALGPQPIGLDANPSWVLYDLLCRPVWGLGIDPADVDLASFQAAADTLVAEGHGCSVVIQTIEDAARVFAAIEAQVDGVVYEAPSTGKIKLKLIRGGYVVDDLPVMNRDNVVARPIIDDVFERDCPNEIRVGFTDRSRDYKSDVLPWKKEASSAARGNQRRPLDFDAPGCTNVVTAAKIAARELSVIGRPLRSIRIKVNRSFYGVELGDAVVVDLPQYQIDAEVYRVLEVDFGQLTAGTIEVRLIRDVFDQTAGGFQGDPAPPNTPVTLMPIQRERWLLDQSPYLLSYLAALSGAVTNTGTQRLLALAASEGPPDPSDRWRADTQAGGGGYYGFGTGPDISPQGYPATAVLLGDYSRTLEPFDDSPGGLLVQFQGGELPSPALFFYELAATPDEIRFTGKNLFMLGGANETSEDGELSQRGEIISCEFITLVSGDQYRMHRIQRGLLDTAPIDHPAGTRLFLLRPELAVGRRDWITGQYVRGFAIPLFGGVAGSDGLSYSSHDLLLGEVGRHSLPLRAADMRAAGYDMDGTYGPQAAPPTYPRLGEFKALTRLEGALDVTGRQNKITAGVVVRGDETTWLAEAGTTWSVSAEKVGSEDGDVELVSGLPTPDAAGLLLAGSGLGHGDIRVKLHSHREVIDGEDSTSWQSPEILVDAPHDRDLLANSSFEYGALSPGWTETDGSASVQSGPDCLQRYSTSGYWVQSSASSVDCTIRQIVDVSGYKPVGLVALVTYYARSFGGGSESVSVTVRARDASDVELTSATDSVTGPSDHWQRDSVSTICPVGTAKLVVEVTVGSGDAAARAGATRIRLQLGEVSAELLTNPSFDGSLTGWTNVLNSFAFNTANPYSSRNGTLGAAQGGAFSSSEVKQETSVPAGYESGTALLQCARSTSTAGDTGEVILEALDSGDAVLASQTTGAEHDFPMGIDTWERRRLALQMPEGTVALRVRLLATRAAGLANSGACFDDFSLRIHKDQDPAFDLDFDFREPSWQPLPQDWQRFHLAFPDVVVPFMSWDGASVTPVVRASHALSGPVHAWSDASSPAPASFRGYWDVGPHALYPEPSRRYTMTTEAYQFTRATAGAAIDLQTTGADDVTGDEYGAFPLDQPFTVAVYFRTDEPTWSGAAGLVGRRSNTGIGWGVRIDASGHLQAVLQGVGGTATVTGVSVQADAAPHWALLVNDPGAGLLRLYTDSAGDWLTASTASVGAIDVAGAPLRIGRDGPASATGGVQIARVFFWDLAVQPGHVLSLLRYGADPSGLLGSWTMDRAIWVPVPDHESIADGDALVRFSPHHVPIGSRSGFGIVTASASTNKIPSNDLTAGTWAAEIGATLTQALVDCTGLPRGVRVTNAGAGQALRCTGVTMGVGTPLSVVLFARTNDGVTRDLVVELRDTGDVLRGTQTVQLTEQWARFHVQLGPWVASTPAAYLRFVLGAAAVGSFDLAHVIWADFGEDAPIAIHDAGLSFDGAGGSATVAMPLQLNREGELYAEISCATAAPPADQSIVVIDVDADTPGLRALATGAAAAPVFTLGDASGVLTSETGDPIDWSAGATLRGRWNRLELPESVGDQVGLVVVDSSADSATYEPLAFTVLGTGLAVISIGGDANIGGPPNAIIHRVVVRAREQKLE